MPAENSQKRDGETPRRSFAQWELTLANLRARIAERITKEISGHSAVLLEVEAATDWQELFDGDEIAAPFDGLFDGGES